MSELGRIYRLTARRAPEPVDVEGFDRSFFEEQETILEITEHRIQFKIEKNLASHPNTCDITIVNLAEATREEFVDGRIRIRFEAGYDGTLRLLFDGDLRYASNELEGTEWLTKLQVADGGRAFAAARAPAKSYAPKTPLLTILRDLAGAFGTPLPAEVVASTDLKARIAAGEVLSGYASDELSRILAPLDLEWSFQNGALQILRVDATRPGTVRVISQDSGMIGAPSVKPPKIRAPTKAKRSKAKPKEPEMTVKHTLFPELIPGEAFEIDSRSIKGRWKIDKLQHEGDNWGADWTTTIEAVSA